uniref:Polyprotein n=1 Tax=Echinostoma caproni TaxID=27848 RepID=A0A183B862_9TREM
LRRSRSRLHIRRPDLVCPNEMPAYLDADADLFEVDETRAAPKLQTNVCWDQQDGSNGAIEWLSNFLQRSFFW